MNYWTGTEVHTGAQITVYDFPLRIGIADYPGGPLKLLGAAEINHMAVVVSTHLGTAMVAVVAEDLVIEAAPKTDIIRGVHQAALRFAREQIEKEMQLERAWNDTTGHSDDAIANILRDSLRSRP